MNDLQGFFKRFGLPPSWATEDGDILVNPDDLGNYPDVNDGDEVFISSDNIVIDKNEISIRGVCSPGNFKEVFTACLAAGNGPGNVRLVKSILRGLEDFEAGVWAYDL